MDLISDTNLLMLYVVGRTDRRLINSHKRLNTLESSDYDLLISLIRPYGALIQTPNILTEASNLLGQVSEPARTTLRKALGALVASASERYVRSPDAVAQKEYSWLGLTDAAILTVLGPGTALMTVDAGLHRAASRRGFRSSNFNQVRDASEG